MSTTVYSRVRVVGRTVEQLDRGRGSNIEEPKTSCHRNEDYCLDLGDKILNPIEWFLARTSFDFGSYSYTHNFGLLILS